VRVSQHDLPPLKRQKGLVDRTKLSAAIGLQSS